MFVSFQLPPSLAPSLFLQLGLCGGLGYCRSSVHNVQKGVRLRLRPCCVSLLLLFFSMSRHRVAVLFSERARSSIHSPLCGFFGLSFPHVHTETYC